MNSQDPGVTIDTEDSSAVSTTELAAASSLETSRRHPTLTGAVVPSPRSLADQLLDGAADGVLACDPRGVLTTANSAARRMFPALRTGEVLGAVIPALRDAVDLPQVELESGDRALVAQRQPLLDGGAAWYLRDVTEHRERMDNLLAERSRSRFLATASRRLGLSLHPGRTARAVVELAAGNLADAAVVVMPLPGGRAQWYGCVGSIDSAEPVGELSERERTVLDSGQIARRDLPEAVLHALIGTVSGPRPLLVDELASAPWMSPLARMRVRNAAVVTLPGNGHPAGALVLLRRDRGGSPGGPSADILDAALAEEYAQRAGLAIAAAGLYAQQAHTTALLTHTLEQPEPPVIPGISFGAAYRPAERGLLIGGDFYDVMAPDQHAPAETMFLLGDVCGKGVSAAVSTGQLRQSVMALRQLERDPVRILELVNATLIDESGDEAIPRLATAVLGTATTTPEGGLRLRLAGGGHQPPIVVRADGIEDVEIGGMLLGAVHPARFRSREVVLAPGESCVLYTDGVTEARGGADGQQAFGEDRLHELLDGCHVMPAKAIAERIVLHATRWQVDESSDDIAALVVQAPMPVRPTRRDPSGRSDPRA